MCVGRFGLRFVFWMFMSMGVFVTTLIKRNQVNVAVPDTP